MNATYAKNLNSGSNAPYRYVFDVNMLSSGDNWPYNTQNGHSNSSLFLSQ